MIFDVILENDINYNEVLKKTERYMKSSYNKNIAKRVFKGRKGRFYALVEPYGIKFDVVIYDDISLYEIEGYLKYVFEGEQLIVLCGKKEKIHFNKLNCIYV